MVKQIFVNTSSANDFHNGETDLNEFIFSRDILQWAVPTGKNTVLPFNKGVC